MTDPNSYKLYNKRPIDVLARTLQENPTYDTQGDWCPASSLSQDFMKNAGWIWVRRCITKSGHKRKGYWKRVTTNSKVGAILFLEQIAEENKFELLEQRVKEIRAAGIVVLGLFG